MGEDGKPWLEAQAVERAVDPTTGAHRVRVRFQHNTDEGVLCEWNIWIPDEESFDRAVDLARKELHRVSSTIASELPSPDPSGSGKAADEPETARLRARRPKGQGGGWMGS